MSITPMQKVCAFQQNSQYEEYMQKGKTWILNQIKAQTCFYHKSGGKKALELFSSFFLHISSHYCQPIKWKLHLLEAKIANTTSHVAVDMKTTIAGISCIFTADYSLPDIFSKVEQYPDSSLDTSRHSNIHLKMTSVENFSIT